MPEDNIKMNAIEVVCEDVSGVELVRDTVHWSAFVKTVTIIQVL
jgi:hypothetical protein